MPSTKSLPKLNETKKTSRKSFSKSKRNASLKLNVKSYSTSNFRPKKLSPIAPLIYSFPNPSSSPTAVSVLNPSQKTATSFKTSLLKILSCPLKSFANPLKTLLNMKSLLKLKASGSMSSSTGALSLTRAKFTSLPITAH